jgi:hypothetical protein
LLALDHLVAGGKDLEQGQARGHEEDANKQGENPINDEGGVKERGSRRLEFKQLCLELVVPKANVAHGHVIGGLVLSHCGREGDLKGDDDGKLNDGEGDKQGDADLLRHHHGLNVVQPQNECGWQGCLWRTSSREMVTRESRGIQNKRTIIFLLLPSFPPSPPL